MRKTSLLLLGVVLFAVGCSTDSNEEKMTNTKQISSFENNTNYNVYAGINTLHNLYVESQGENANSKELSQIISGVEDVALNSGFASRYNFNKEEYKGISVVAMQRILVHDLDILREVNYSEYVVEELERVLATEDASNLEGLRYRINKRTDISNSEKDFLLNSMSAGDPPYGIDPEWRKGNLIALLYYSKQSELNVATATTVLKVVLD